MKQVTLTTEGACIGNPEEGGWAYILRYGTNVSERSGSAPAVTTNNRREIQAAIEGLKALKEPCEITLITDSTYLMNGITTWLHALARERLGDSPQKQQARPQCRFVANSGRTVGEARCSVPLGQGPFRS